MKKISMIFAGAFLVLMMSACSTTAQPSIAELNKGQNLQIFSVSNKDGALNAKTVQEAFKEAGVIVDVNNDMNSIFSKRYGSVAHKKYNLAIFTNEALLKKLMDKYPTIGMITPLTMSIYVDEADNINVTTLSLEGMARITGIPVNDADLVTYSKLVDEALHKALPNGEYLRVNHTKNTVDLVTEFTTEFEADDSGSYAEAINGFKDEFEGEISPIGFLVPKSYSYKHDAYDFFETYSIIRFNAIYPVYKKHPDAGAYAPFSLVIYKKKDEDTVHISYPSIDNWIKDLDIKDEETIKAVIDTQEKMKNVLSGLTE